MKQFKDLFGNPIRLSEERYSHLLDAHPEMKGQLNRMRLTLLTPEWIIRSNSDSDVVLYYKNFVKTKVGNKYLCIVVKILQNDYYVLTAYFTDTIKRGEIIWHRKRK